MNKAEKKKAQQKKAYKKWYAKNKEKCARERFKRKQEILATQGKNTNYIETHIKCLGNTFINVETNNKAILYKTSQGFYYTITFTDFRQEYTSPFFKSKSTAIDDLRLAL